MKLGLLAFVASIFLSAPAASASTQPTRHCTVNCHNVADHSSIDVGTFTIVGSYRPRAAAPKHSLRFVCGPMHDNLVGGRNSNCSWQ